MTLSEDKTTATCGFCDTTVLLSAFHHSSALERTIRETEENRKIDRYRTSVHLYESAKKGSTFHKVGAYERLIPLLEPLANIDFQSSREMLEESNKIYPKLKKKWRKLKFAQGIAMIVILSIPLRSNILNQQTVEPTPYESAMILYENGEFFLASQAFLAIQDFEDSGKMAIESFYYYGTELMQEQNYSEAIEVLSIVEHYEKTEETLVECRYLYGIYSMENGDFGTAEEQFSHIPEYKDVGIFLTELLPDTN